MKKIFLLMFLIPSCLQAQNYFNSTGNAGVNVGGVAPYYHFQINSSGVNSYLHFTTSVTGNSPSNGFIIGSGDAGQGIIMNRGNTDIIFNNNGGARMWLKPTGYLGLGTADPANLFEIQRNQNLGTSMIIRNTSSGVDALGGLAAIGQNQYINILAFSDGYSRLYPGFHPSSVAIVGNASNGLNIISNIGAGTAGPNTGVIRFITSTGDVTSNTTGNDTLTRMIIDATGNVGIGNKTPGSLLTVGSSSKRGSLMIKGDQPTIAFSDINIGSHQYNLYAGMSATGSFDIFDQNAATAAEKFRLTINAAGNVGIGTGQNSYSDKLTVNGNIRAKKLTISVNGWSDYVFNDDYKLRSLDNVEQFIKTNKHLPEVPSAKEVEEKGISVGDNQALLLKKIEELTLYMIEAEKNIKGLKAKVNFHAKEISALKEKSKK